MRGVFQNLKLIIKHLRLSEELETLMLTLCVTQGMDRVRTGQDQTVYII